MSPTPNKAPRMKPLAITGLGAVSPLGVGLENWPAAFAAPERAAEAAFAPVSTVFEQEKYPGAKGAEVWGFDPVQWLGKKGHRNFDRLTKYLIVAGGQALIDAGVKRDGEFIGKLQPSDIGVCSSTAYGSLDSITELNRVAELENPRYINPARFPNTVINAAAGYVSIWEDLRAPNVTIVDGNCGALDAVLTCETHLRHGRADAFLVGGGDVLSEPLYLAFQRLGAIADGDAPWLPGSRKSRGMHLGEGAGYLMVERMEDAEARGARIRGRLTGYGTAFEAPKREGRLLHASGAAVARAIEAALTDAGLVREDVDVVCSALSGLRPFDTAELAGIDQALGADVPLVAPKSIWGESFSGASSLALVAATLFTEGMVVGPLVGTDAPESVKHVLVLSVGYYGNVSAVVVSGA